MSQVIEELNNLGKKALDDIQAAASGNALEEIRISILGKKGALSHVLRGMATLDPRERPALGSAANEWKRKIEGLIDERRQSIEESEIQERLSKEKVDVSLPSLLPHRGSVHLLTRTVRRICEILGRIGFDVNMGPEVETEYLNFDAINIPSDHPARDMQDTFFMGKGVVLRTHTSPVQMRTMLSRKPPVRILCPGAVYRVDNDATHSPMFSQIEGLWVDQGVRMSDLKGVLEFFAKEMFGPETAIRLRPSYFPFTEPSAEVDVSCYFCRKKSDSKGCRLCKGTGWIEILGAGMVHPHLFKEAGYSDGELSGFAFGIGIERVTMLLYGIPDLRMFFQGDVRFLGQF